MTDELHLDRPHVAGNSVGGWVALELARTLAAWALRLKGYRILSRRLKTPLGEIDMVALPLFGGGSAGR